MAASHSLNSHKSTRANEQFTEIESGFIQFSV